MMDASEAVTIEAAILGLGHSGDGIAETGGRRLFVPFTAPGDRVSIRTRDGARAELVRILERGSEHIEPACAHFGACGGCALQHLAPVAYTAFKRDQVIRALRQRGFADPPVAKPVIIAPGTRRRAALSVRRPGRGPVLLGFLERGSRTIVDVGACPVMLPQLENLIAPLRPLLETLLQPRGKADIRLTGSETGTELALNLGRAPGLADREVVAEFAEVHRLPRVVWDGEIMVERAAPRVSFGGVPVTLPPAPFLQATQAGERTLVAVTAEAIPGEARKIADLFCGTGAFTLPLSARAAIDAFDADQPAIAALARAAAQADRRVTARERDLFRRPLEPVDLNHYDAVVLDPPHAGARAQAERLAASDVGCIVMASCNPATFARDARILVEGGYRLEAVTPVDQFRWSAEVELVAVLRKEGR